MSQMRVPPQNLEAEQSVLGAILLDNDAVNKALELLRPEDFYRPGHQKIFSAFIELDETSTAIDLVTATSHLKDKNILEEIGGSSYLASLLDQVPSATNVEFYARMVREKSVLRRLINVSSAIAAKGYEEGQSAEEFLDFAENEIFQVSEQRINPAFAPIKDIVKDSFKRIETLYEKKEMVTGVASGFLDLDKMTSGLQPADLIILAGRPSMGKTSLALNVSQYAAVQAKKIVAVFFARDVKRADGHAYAYIGGKGRRFKASHWTSGRF